MYVVRFSAILFVVVFLVSACEVKLMIESCEEGSGEVVESTTEITNRLTVIPTEVWMESQYHLDTYPSQPGGEEELAADAVMSEQGAVFQAEGLVYEVTLDLEGAFAEEFLAECHLLIFV